MQRVQYAILLLNSSDFVRLVAEDQTCCMSTDPGPLLGESKADLTYAR